MDRSRASLGRLAHVRRTRVRSRTRVFGVMPLQRWCYFVSSSLVVSLGRRDSCHECVRVVSRVRLLSSPLLHWPASPCFLSLSRECWYENVALWALPQQDHTLGPRRRPIRLTDKQRETLDSALIRGGGAKWAATQSSRTTVLAGRAHDKPEARRRPRPRRPSPPRKENLPGGGSHARGRVVHPALARSMLR